MVHVFLTVFLMCHTHDYTVKSIFMACEHVASLLSSICFLGLQSAWIILDAPSAVFTVLCASVHARALWTDPLKHVGALICCI